MISQRISNFNPITIYSCCLVAALSWILTSVPLAVAVTVGACTSDSDCETGTSCIAVDTGRTTFRKCTLDTAASPACRNRLAGNCPSQDGSLGPLICTFVPTTKLRDVVCCNTLRHRQLQNTTTGTSASCFECFKDPNAEPVDIDIIVPPIAGSYECLIESQCKSTAAFPDACKTGETCATDKGTLCNGKGTCSPSDPDDPVNSYRCVCNTGFSGTFCEKIASNECVVDCGRSSQGECLENECECSTGFAGDQCADCTSDTVCNSAANAGTCNLITGQCDCNAGFEGDAYCGSVGGDICDGITCGASGQCIDGGCVCLTDCAGSRCRACDEPSCADCDSAISQGPAAILLLFVSIMILTLWC